MTKRLKWPGILAQAEEIVRSYDTPVTLRQLFYRLVSAGRIPNTQSAYSRLSMLTAQARRDGTFPALFDGTREVHRPASWTSPRSALVALTKVFRLDRTEGQEHQVWLGVEKAALKAQMEAWFGDFGVPVVVLRGYSSQTYTDNVRAEVEADGRPAVLLYAGDHDASGEDIDRDFIERTNCWEKVVRVALSEDQVDQFGLVKNPGKRTDSRAAGFEAKYGELVQVEVDALDPRDLRALFTEALDEWWDDEAYAEVLSREPTGWEPWVEAALDL